MQFGINRLSDLPKVEEIDELVGEKLIPPPAAPGLASEEHAGQGETQ